MDPVTTVNEAERSARRGRAQEAAQAAGIDLLVISPSADLTYLTGYAHKPSDRPTLLLLPADGTPFMVAPKLEAMKVEAKTGGRLPVIAWDETENPFAVARAHIKGPVGRLAVAEQMWAGDLLRLQEQFSKAAVVSAGPLVTSLRIRKSAAELEQIRAAGRLADTVYELILAERFVGRSEAELADRVNALTRGAGGAAPGCILAAGPNSASPHHSPGDRVIAAGDAVWVDYGGRVGGYPSDVTRTVFAGGGAPAEFRRVYDVVRRAQEAAVAAVRPGLSCEHIDQVARQIIVDAGYGGGILHRTGHGLGLEGHEHPYIVEGNATPLEPGMVFSVEPGIYLAGRFGVRIEDIVAVTEDGVEVFNHSSHDLFEVK